MSIPEKPARPVFTSDWLFHRAAFLKTVSPEAVRSFYQYNADEVLICLRCMIRENTATTALEGLYGCMELTENAHPSAFLEYVRTSLDASGVSRLSLTLFPEEYDKVSWKTQREALQESGFQQAHAIEHRLIAVTEEENEPLASNDWRAEAGSLTEFSVTEEPLMEYDKIRKLVSRSETRQETNGQDDLPGSCFHIFPEKTHVFAVRDGAKYCALGVFVESGPGILYAVELTQVKEYAEKKPVLALFQFVYEWAELQDYHYIDLGRIDMEVEENIGLVRGSGEQWVLTW